MSEEYLIIISSFMSSLKYVDVCGEEFYLHGAGEGLLQCYTHYFFLPFGPIIALFVFPQLTRCLKVISLKTFRKFKVCAQNTIPRCYASILVVNKSYAKKFNCCNYDE